MKEMKEAFTFIELLIVLAIIAILISILVPIGVRAINEAKTITVANNLSQISVAVMSEFYLNHNIVTKINDLSAYFGDQSGLLDKYALNVTQQSTLIIVNIWYTGGDVVASVAKKYMASIVSTGDNVPMVRTILAKYW